MKSNTIIMVKSNRPISCGTHQCFVCTTIREGKSIAVKIYGGRTNYCNIRTIRIELNVINSRLLALISPDPERRALAGDQLAGDLSLSPANLPAWSRLRIGDAVIEVTDQPHIGCSKFTQRFGLDAHRFVNSEAGRAVNLRGINARVLVPGTIREGDRITVERPAP